MAAAISALLKDNSRRKEMSNNAMLAVKEFYPDKVYELWEALFNRDNN